MNQEVATALIGLGGAVLGAGATSITTWLSFRHQRRTAKEARLHEVGRLATDTALSKLIELQDLVEASAASSGASRDDREPWERTARMHFRDINLALLRIPSDAVHERLAPTLALAKQYRYAGPRHFHYLHHVQKVSQDMINVLSAYIRDAKLPLPHEDVAAARRSVEAARESERLRYEEMRREYEELRAEEPEEPDDLP
ncbi:hypothetical protein ACSHXN_17975 [Streptomyces sp. HUAS TT11]|uniref:hypothetical protein n=1 Tax=Streptomyces sp. HUAS TT11 TaxID=3447508 RepID=UPI003F660626